jgi:hypothetical protein
MKTWMWIAGGVAVWYFFIRTPSVVVVPVSGAMS